MEIVGEKIYNLRKEKNVSQEELAEAVSVARPTISRWENNTVIPTTENIKKLCAFFGVGINYFLSEEEIAVTKEERQPAAEKINKLKTLKTVSAVVGIVLLVLCVIACGIGAFVILAPDEGKQYIDVRYSVNYEGIIFLIVGVLALAVLITLTVIFTKRYIKNKKNK